LAQLLGVGEDLSMSYLAELTVEKADASQHCADLVLAVSHWHGYEGNLQLDNITILNQLWSDGLEPVTCQFRKTRMLSVCASESLTQCLRSYSLFSGNRGLYFPLCVQTTSLRLCGESRKGLHRFQWIEHPPSVLLLLE
jgi:hypothetical protein